MIHPQPLLDDIELYTEMIERNIWLCLLWIEQVFKQGIDNYDTKWKWVKFQFGKMDQGKEEFNLNKPFLNGK